MQDCKKPVKKYGKQSKKRMKKMQSDNRIYYRMLNCIVLSTLLILLIITFLLLHNKKQRELEEKQAIAEMITQAELSEAEHQVDTVQEPIPDVIEPMPDEYYEAVELLARMIHCENSNEVDGEPACWKTGSVAVNRMNDPEYPDTIEGVIRQPNQYDCLSKLYKEEPTDIEYEVAAELLQSGSVIPSNVVFAAEFYQGSGCYNEEGKTKYCYK